MRIDSLAEDRICARAGVGIPSTGTGSHVLKASGKDRDLAICSKIIFFILIATVGIDFLNGLTSIDILGQLIRVAFFILLLYVELRIDKKGFFVILAALLYCVFVMLASFMADGTIGLSSLTYEIGVIVKLLLFFSIFRVVTKLNECGYIPVSFIDSVFKVSAIYVPILYLGTSILGIGVSSYSGGQGFKSVFLSLNSINIAMLLLYAFCLEKCFAERKAAWAPVALLNAVSLFMLGTKSSIVFVLVLFLFYLIAPKRNRPRNFILGLLISAVFYFLFLQVDYLQALLASVSERQAYLFENRNFIDYLTSGRTWMLGHAITLLSSDMADPLGVFQLLFGNGYYCFHNVLSEISGYLSTSIVRPIEFDWADLFVSYGFIMTFFVYGFLLTWLMKIVQSSKRSQAGFYLIAFGVLFVFSCLGGHVMFESISSTFLGLVLAGGVLSIRDNSKARQKIAGAPSCRVEAKAN